MDNMPHFVNIDLLPQHLQELVLEYKRREADKPDALLTYQDVQRIYGYSYTSLRGYVHSGALHPVRTAHGPRFTHAEIQRYIASVDHRRGHKNPRP